MNDDELIPEAAESSEDQSANKNSFLLFIVILSILLGFFAYLNKNFHSLNFKEDYDQILYCLIFVVFISRDLAYSRKFIQDIKYLLYFFLIFILLLVGFSYKDDLIRIKNKVFASFLPGHSLQLDINTYQYEMSNDGHFYIKALVNKKEILFLVDTGATDVVLSPKDASILGIKESDYEGMRMYETANGNSIGGLYTLDEISIHNLKIKDIQVSVNKAPMRNSLLGMAFFNHLKEFKFNNGKLIISWEMTS